MTQSHLLAVKARLKRRQPKFVRQDAHKKRKVKAVWRYPRGLHSKMRDSRRGYRVRLQEGYHTPRAVRGLDKQGLRPTLVATLAQLALLDPKAHSIILAAGLGGRKKLLILTEAAKRQFVVRNARPDAAEAIKARVAKQQQDKKARAQSKTERQKALESKAESKAKAKKAEEKTEEEKEQDAQEKAKEEQEKQEEEKQKVLHQK